MIEHDIVSIIEAIPEEGLASGSKGTIVHVYGNGLVCEVEFVTDNGCKIVTVDCSNLS